LSLPNFLIIGAAKSGTTALYDYLKQHPEIYLSPVKEPRFLAFEGQRLNFRGPGDQSHFNHASITNLVDYRALFSGVKNEKAIGEASTVYLYYHETVPNRIRTYIPDARLIVVLRNPVDRAYSSYLHLARDGHETLDFAQSLEHEEERIADNWTPIWHYVRRGLYHAQLKSYFEKCAGNQIRVFLYDEFRKSPATVLRTVYRFLGVDDSFAPDTSRRFNVSGIPRNRLFQSALAKLSTMKPLLPATLASRAAGIATRMRDRNLTSAPPLSPHLRAKLVEVFRADILQLQDLLGRDLSAWLK
jgi:hypothetical protein